MTSIPVPMFTFSLPSSFDVMRNEGPMKFDPDRRMEFTFRSPLTPTLSVYKFPSNSLLTQKAMDFTAKFDLPPKIENNDASQYMETESMTENQNEISKNCTFNNASSFVTPNPQSNLIEQFLRNKIPFIEDKCTTNLNPTEILPPSKATAINDNNKFQKAYWACPTCYLNNNYDAVKCIVCETLKSDVNNPFLSLLSKGYGTKFNQPEDNWPSSTRAFDKKYFSPKSATSASIMSWTCDICLFSNRLSTNRCIACDALRTDLIGSENDIRKDREPCFRNNSSLLSPKVGNGGKRSCFKLKKIPLGLRSTTLNYLRNCEKRMEVEDSCSSLSSTGFRLRQSKEILIARNKNNDMDIEEKVEKFLGLTKRCPLKRKSSILLDEPRCKMPSVEQYCVEEFGFTMDSTKWKNLFEEQLSRRPKNTKKRLPVAEQFAEYWQKKKKLLKDVDYWECPTCSINNKNDSIKCVCCDAAKPSVSLTTSSSTSPIFFDDDTQSSSSTACQTKITGLATTSTQSPLEPDSITNSPCFTKDFVNFDRKPGFGDDVTNKKYHFDFADPSTPNGLKTQSQPQQENVSPFCFVGKNVMRHFSTPTWTSENSSNFNFGAVASIQQNQSCDNSSMYHSFPATDTNKQKTSTEIVRFTATPIGTPAPSFDADSCYPRFEFENKNMDKNAFMHQDQFSPCVTSSTLTANSSRFVSQFNHSSPVIMFGEKSTSQRVTQSVTSSILPSNLQIDTQDKFLSQNMNGLTATVPPFCFQPIQQTQLPQWPTTTKVCENTSSYSCSSTSSTRRVHFSEENNMTSQSVAKSCTLNFASSGSAFCPERSEFDEAETSDAGFELKRSTSLISMKPVSSDMSIESNKSLRGVVIEDITPNSPIIFSSKKRKYPESFEDKPKNNAKPFVDVFQSLSPSPTPFPESFFMSESMNFSNTSTGGIPTSNLKDSSNIQSTMSSTSQTSSFSVGFRTERNKSSSSLSSSTFQDSSTTLSTKSMTSVSMNKSTTVGADIAANSLAPPSIFNFDKPQIPTPLRENAVVDNDLQNSLGPLEITPLTTPVPSLETLNSIIGTPCNLYDDDTLPSSIQFPDEDTSTTFDCQQQSSASPGFQFNAGSISSDENAVSTNPDLNPSIPAVNNNEMENPFSQPSCPRPVLRAVRRRVNK